MHACVRACVCSARVGRQRNVTYRRRPHKVQSCLLRRPARPIKAIHRAQSRALLRARSARSLRHAANHVQEWGCPSHLGIVQLLRQRPHESCRALRSRCSIACGRAELFGLACHPNVVCASGCGCEHQVVNGGKCDGWRFGVVSVGEAIEWLSAAAPEGGGPDGNKTRTRGLGIHVAVVWHNVARVADVSLASAPLPRYHHWPGV